MLYVFSKITGELEAIAEPGSEMSAWEGENFLTTENTSNWDPSFWTVVDGELTQRTEEDLLSRAKSTKFARLQTDYEAYAESKYNAKWQSSAREFRGTFEEVATSPEATTEQKAAAEQGLALLASLKTWLFDAIMDYYAAQAQAIKLAATQEELDAIAWDFSTLDATNPQVSITSDLYPLKIQATTN